MRKLPYTVKLLTCIKNFETLRLKKEIFITENKILVLDHGINNIKLTFFRKPVIYCNYYIYE